MIIDKTKEHATFKTEQQQNNKMKKTYSEHYLTALNTDVICNIYTTQNKQTDINK